MRQHKGFVGCVAMMRCGYAGRALVYAVVAGFSLYAIWQGGQAKGTSSALSQLESTLWGGAVLLLIFVGLVAYGIWRVIDAFYDLEAYGSDGKGLIARTGMIVTGLVHLAIGFLAVSLLAGDGREGGGSSISAGVAEVMGWPGGRWVIGTVGLIVIGAGLYYAWKGWTEQYRHHLRANRFTTRWNGLLKAGLIAQGCVTTIVGLLFMQAAWHADPAEAGGADKAFGWLTAQPYGQGLVAAICLGLLAFAVFCMVNAAYRIVPGVAGDDIETLAARLETMARQARRDAARG